MRDNDIDTWVHLIYLWLPPEGVPKYRSSNVRVAGGVCGVKWWCLSLAVGLAVSLAVDGNGDGDGILKVLLLKILIFENANFENAHFENVNF